MKRHLTFWNVGLLLVMLVGVGFLLTGWDAGLPLYESVDEVVNLDETYALRGIGDAQFTKPGYPPGILYVNYGAQLLTEAVTGDSAWNQACTVIRDVRMTGVIASLCTALLIALTARKLGGDAAGLLAALAWVVAPEVLAQSQFGFPQAYEGLMYMLALYLALLALERRSPRYALLSTLAGLGAILFKYSIFPALGLGVGATLWLLRSDGKRWLRVLGLQIEMIVLTAVGLVLLGGVGSLAGSGHVETDRFLAGGFLQMFHLPLIQHIHEVLVGQLGWALPLFMGLLIVGTVAFWRQSKTFQRLGWLGAVGLMFSHTLFLGAYIAKDDVGRNLLTTSGLVAVISAVCLVALGKLLGRLIHQPLAGTLAIAGASVLWVGPLLIGGWQWIQYRHLPVTYAAMVAWADQTMPEETLLVNDPRPFTRQWSCYQGHWRETVSGEITDYSLDEWQAQGIYYAVLDQPQIETLQATTAGRAYVDQMTLLKTFPPPGEEDQWRTWRRGYGPNIAVYRLWSVDPDVPLTTVFGSEIRLDGYNLRGSATPGSSLTLRFYWQPVRPPSADYNVYVHLTPVDDEATILAQIDSFPARSTFRPTSTWDDLDESFVSQDLNLSLPDDLPPGDYRLRVGLYDWRSGMRLSTDDGAGFVAIPLKVLDAQN